MVKKLSLISIVCFLFLLSACDSGQEVKHEKLSSTDLSSVNIDGIVIGQAINDVDLKKYTAEEPERFGPKENVYYFQELHIKTDDNGVVRELKGNIYDYIDGTNAIQFSIKETDNPLSIDQVVELLGRKHNMYWFNREQRIKAYTYYDDNGKFYATFAYDYNSKGLVWVILCK